MLLDMGARSTKYVSCMKMEELRKFIEPDYGLLDEMLTFKELSHMQYDHIRSITAGVYQRNDQLLQYVSQSADPSLLIKALQKTDQQHVVNFIQGAYEKFDDRPLEEEHLDKLNVNFRQLVELMNLRDGLLDDMASCGCITWEQRDAIKELNLSSAEKNRKLLDIMRRRSVAHYNNFLTCLRRNSQSHLAGLLTYDKDIPSAPEIGENEMKSELNPSEVEEMKASYASGGEEECRRLLQTKCNELEDIPLNLAVLGNSGVGKSSFVNAIRGLSLQDEGAAPVGVTEFAIEPRSYEHPNNPMLKWWDLPGVGTDQFPKEKYLDEIEVGRYDFFLLLTDTRFTENDTWLKREIRKREKKCFFVRTKIGFDISNNAKSYPDTRHNEEAVLEKIRESIAKQLEESGCDDIPVFLIDNLEPTRFEFEKLKLKLIEDFEDQKKAAMVLSLPSTSGQMIQLKVDELRRRIWKKALLWSGAQALLPMPGVSSAVDVAVVSSEANFYFRRLNLDDESLQRYAALYSTDYNKMKLIVNKEMTALVGTKEGIKTAAVPVPAVVLACLRLAAPTVAKISLPLMVIGGMIPVPLSFGGTYSSLKLVLDTYEKVAKEIARYIAGNAAMTEEIEGAESTNRKSAGTTEQSVKFNVEESTEVTH